MKRKGEGSKPPKPKKNKVDPLQQSLLSFFQPLDGSRREDQQEELLMAVDGRTSRRSFRTVTTARISTMTSTWCSKIKRITAHNRKLQIRP